MIIGVDGNEANVVNRVGVSMYTYELLKYFHTHAGEDTQFKIFLRERPLPDLPKPTEYFSYEYVQPYYFWSHFSLPLALRKHTPDVFFSPAHYSPRFCPCPIVVTIHDLAYKYYPEEFLKKDLYKLNNRTMHSVERAKKVICVSKNTQKDLEKYHPSTKHKSTVIYNGFNPIPAMKTEGVIEVLTDTLKFLNFDEKTTLFRNPFILYVGTLQARKNLPALIDAFEAFHARYPEFRLLLVGKPGWLYKKTLERIKNSPVKECIQVTGYVSDGFLKVLYRTAFCLVLPSLYEGFGLPVLEAMANECPVIVSDNSSLPEVAGPAALYIDPKHPETITSALNSLLDLKKRKTLIARGREQIKKFSWEQCGKETLEVLRSAAK